LACGPAAVSVLFSFRRRAGLPAMPLEPLVNEAWFGRVRAVA
jgi:hypothetical protein